MGSISCCAVLSVVTVCTETVVIYYELVIIIIRMYGSATLKLKLFESFAAAHAGILPPALALPPRCRCRCLDTSPRGCALWPLCLCSPCAEHRVPAFRHSLAGTLMRICCHPSAESCRSVATTKAGHA